MGDGTEARAQLYYNYLLSLGWPPAHANRVAMEQASRPGSTQGTKKDVEAQRVEDEMARLVKRRDELIGAREGKTDSLLQRRDQLIGAREAARAVQLPPEPNRMQLSGFRPPADPMAARKAIDILRMQQDRTPSYVQDYNTTRLPERSYVQNYNATRLPERSGRVYFYNRAAGFDPRHDAGGE
jgi:hypothetical protein